MWRRRICRAARGEAWAPGSGDRHLADRNRPRTRARGQRGEEDRIEFRVLDAEYLDFPDDAFDLVCGLGAIHHLDLESALSEWCAS